MAELKPPRITREDIDPLDAEQARRLLETSRGDRLEALYVLALNTGITKLLPLSAWKAVRTSEGAPARSGADFWLSKPTSMNPPVPRFLIEMQALMIFACPSRESGSNQALSSTARLSRG